MQTSQESVLLSNIIITIGVVHFPLALAIGALIGAGLFILNSKQRAPWRNCVYFVFAFTIGLFGGQTMGAALSKILPFIKDTEFIDAFSGALISAALFIGVIEIGIKITQAKTNIGSAKP